MEILAKKLNQIIEDADSYFGNQLNWDFKPGPEKWSGKQILGHLIDSANNNIQRFVRGTYQQDFKIVYDQNQWVKYQYYEKSDVSDLIQLWTLLNQQIIRIWSNYPPEKTKIKSDIGQNSPEIKTILEIAEGYIEHLKHHLDQISNVTSSNK